MKAHAVAKILEQLAAMLRAGPDVQLSGAHFSNRDGGDAARTRDIAVNLTTLAELSRLNKSEWQTIIEHYRLPVLIKKTDSTRDLLGRLLNYLEKNPEERNRIRKEAVTSSTEASPELLRAFKILLGE